MGIGVPPAPISCSREARFQSVDDFPQKMKFKRFNKTYLNVRRFFNLTLDEAEAIKVVLTRALHITRLEDRIIGFQFEEKESPCYFNLFLSCKNKTKLYAVVQRRTNKKLYLVPICVDCIKKNLELYFKELTNNLKRTLSQPKYLVYMI